MGKIVSPQACNLSDCQQILCLCQTEVYIQVPWEVPLKAAQSLVVTHCVTICPIYFRQVLISSLCPLHTRCFWNRRPNFWYAFYGSKQRRNYRVAQNMYTFLLINIFGINLNEISISGWECNIMFSQQMSLSLYLANVFKLKVPLQHCLPFFKRQSCSSHVGSLS